MRYLAGGRAGLTLDHFGVPAAVHQGLDAPLSSCRAWRRLFPASSSRPVELVPAA